MAFKAFVKTNNKYFMDKLASVRFYDEALFANNIYDGPVHAHVIT